LSLAVKVEEDVTERMHQLQEDEGRAEDEVDTEIRSNDLFQFGFDGVENFAHSRHHEN
jgi:hypothetical protein